MVFFMSKVCDFSEINIYAQNIDGNEGETCNKVLEVRTPLGEFIAMLETKADKIYFKRQIIFPNTQEAAEKIKDSYIIKQNLASIKNKAKAMFKDKKYNIAEVGDIDKFYAQKVTEYADKYKLSFIRLSVPDANADIVYGMGAILFENQSHWYAMEHMQAFYDFSAYIPKKYFSFDRKDLPLWDEETKSYYLHDDHPLLGLFIQIDSLIKEQRMNPSKEFSFKPTINDDSKSLKDETQDDENDQTNTKMEGENPKIEDIIEKTFEQPHKSIAEIVVITGSKVVKQIEKGVKKIFKGINS